MARDMGNALGLAIGVGAGVVWWACCQIAEHGPDIAAGIAQGMTEAVGWWNGPRDDKQEARVEVNGEVVQRS